MAKKKKAEKVEEAVEEVVETVEETEEVVEEPVAEEAPAEEEKQSEPEVVPASEDDEAFLASRVRYYRANRGLAMAKSQMLAQRDLEARK